MVCSGGPGGEGGPHLDDVLAVSDTHLLGRHAGLDPPGTVALPGGRKGAISRSSPSIGSPTEHSRLRSW